MLRSLVKKFGLDDCKTSKTPMAIDANLGVDEGGRSTNIHQYRAMIDSLLYIMTSRPDIIFSVCLCARYQTNPKESHLVALKRILRYIKGTLNLGLWYGRKTKFNLIGFTDADFAGDRLDRKNTSGTCQFLGGSLVSWSSHKQNSVALSTVEVEYIAARSYCTQILWMIQTLQDYNLCFSKIPIMCDNTSAIMISKNSILHARTKHIEIRYHFIHDHVERGDIELIHVDTKN
jgi:hypothetical protein